MGPKLRSYQPEELIQQLPENAVVVTAMAAAEPRRFFETLHGELDRFKQLTVFCANPSEPYPCFTDLTFADRVTLVPMFLTSSVRNYHGHNLVHYSPQHLSQWSDNLIHTREIDMFWGTCSPPDDRGFVSLGLSSVYEPEIIRHAKKVVLEVNPNVPVTHGATCVHFSEVDAFVETEYELPTIKPAVADDIDKKIAAHVASYIEDDCTIQLGIGGIPNAVAALISDRKNLGIHTEMINNAMMDLYEKGIVTGLNKTLWPRKIVGAFALGSKELYDFVNFNPGVTFQPAKVVNDPYRIGRNYRMISINTAVEVDITGQVCSESIGHTELSGVGGAAETHIGAQRSTNGKGIIAIRSLTKKGTSKINCSLIEGAKVSISRNDIDTIVTEYGAAELKGRTVAERADALIAIAHPDQRDELKSRATELKYL